MSIPTIQNVFHGKIKLLFSDPTPKTITLGAHTFGGLYNFHEFPIQALTNRHHTPYPYWLFEKKMRQNEEAVILALMSFLSLNRLCPKSAPEQVIKGQGCPGLPNAPEPLTIFDYFCWIILPWTTLCLVETVPDPTIFYFFWIKNFATDRSRAS